jgi:hypothetical protein
MLCCPHFAVAMPMYLTTQLTAEQFWPSLFSLHVGPNKHGVLVPLPHNTSKGDVQSNNRKRTTTSTRRTTIVPADASCNFALTVLKALSLAQPIRSSSPVSYIFRVRWPLKICSFTNKLKHSKLKSQLSSFHPERRRKKANNQP